jgi:trehalose 6-phosphate phosphatase
VWRAALTALAARHTTAVVSGRSLEKVRSLVAVPGMVYAGSHGFDIAGPAGTVAARTVGEEWRPALVAAAADLAAEVLPAFPGAAVEDNKLSMSLHYRNAALDPVTAAEEADADAASTASSSSSASTTVGGAPSPRSLAALEAAVDEIVGRHGLRRTRGKCVLELRPTLDWHKGKAVSYLLDVLGLADPGVLPVYVGDDVTDEDAFGALAGCGGIGVRVACADDRTETRAQLRLEDTVQVCELLEYFAHTPGAVPAGAYAAAETTPPPPSAVAVALSS